MSAADYFVTEFEWAISNPDTIYPFTAPCRMSSVFADATISVPSFTGPVRIHSLSSAADGSRLTLHSGSDSITLTAGTVADYGIWRVLSWSSTTGAAKIMLLQDRIPTSWPLQNTATTGFLAPRALQGTVQGVDAILVGGVRLTGDVRLVAGTGFSTGSTASEAGRGGFDINLTEEEYTEDCTDRCPPFVRTINGITPSGINDFSLEGVDCYLAVPSLVRSVEDEALIEPAKLLLKNDCSPCCDCDDYARVYEEVLRPLIEKGHDLADRYRELMAKYKSAIEAMEAAAACKSVPEVILKTTPGRNRSAYVMVGLRNNKQAAWPEFPSRLTIRFSANDGTTCKVVDDAVMIHDGESRRTSAEIGTSTVTVLVHPLECCTMIWYTFSLVWQGVGGTVGYTVSTSGGIDGHNFSQSAIGTTLPPVGRERE